jgi:D-alanyl-D-alanine carboxypeptidase (penicillin-binding protein 5/6)
VVYSGPVFAPVKEGQEIARLKLFRGATLALDMPLKAGETVETGPLHRRALDAALELGGALVRKYVFRQ